MNLNLFIPLWMETAELADFGKRRYLQVGRRYLNGYLSRVSSKIIRKNITAQSGFRHRKATQNALYCSCSALSKRSPNSPGTHVIIKVISAIRSKRWCSWSKRIRCLRWSWWKSLAWNRVEIFSSLNEVAEMLISRKALTLPGFFYYNKNDSIRLH